MKKGYDADVQKATDKHIADIDKLLADKIKDIETI
jgi:ribosome recycling factor